MSLYKTHIISQIHKPHLKNDNTLYVIGVISNPVRFHSRYRLAREWIESMVKTPHVKLIMVETAFGDRHHELEDFCIEHNVEYHPIRNRSSIWIKEAMINIGGKIAIHKFHAKHLAWIDCDVFFKRKNWAQETLHQLQHYDIVQPWSDCVDLGPEGQILETHKSFGSLIARGIRRQKKPGEPYHFGHPGFAWACTRKFWENTYGLMHWAILGSGDHHMACSLVNEVEGSMHGEMSEGFKRACREWQKRAYKITHGRVGYVPGLIDHQFHGSKKRRYYRERWQILVDHNYDPFVDLQFDDQGLVELIGKVGLEQAIHLYNLSRMEDGIEP